MPNISMSFNMAVDDLVESIVDSGYALPVIKAIDLRFAEADFTESLIKMLIESLKRDYTEDEMRQLIKELSEI